MSTAQASDGLAQLRLQLRAQPAGQIEDTSTVERLLAKAWDGLGGGNEGGMEAYKLLHRTFEMFWEPPVLRFRVERHGAIVAGGSGYAEIQSWNVDVEAGTAHLVDTGKRRVRPTQSKLDIEQLAVELTNLIVSGEQDERLRWSGDRVQIRMASVLPAASRQTTEGRQKRLNKSLGVHLRVHGWERRAGGWWART